MTAYTDSLGFAKGEAAFWSHGYNRVARNEVLIDYAAIVAARSAASAAALAAGDTLEVMPIPAGSLVLAAGVSIITAGAATSAVDLGDGSSATAFLSNKALTSEVAWSSELAAPVFYQTEGVVKFLFKTALPTGLKAKVWVLLLDCNA